MTTRFGHHCIFALSAAALLVGCKGNGNANTDTTTAAGAVATGSDSANRAAGATTGAAANAGASASNNNWTDAQILAFASAANKGEIAEGKLAETKATNPKVKAFARQMVTDHTAMLNEGKSFAKKNNITPDSTKNDIVDLQKNTLDEMQDLQSKAKGNDWDKDFVNKEIDDHKQVLQKLQDMQNATTNTQLKDMLTKATQKVQSHLDKAQALKDSTLKS